MGEIKKKVYYRYKFKITSAMNIGNGQNEVTDNDLIKDGSGTPYIPGSTITGIFRSVLPKEYQSLFGTVKNLETDTDKNGQPEIEASQVILYDAKIKKKDYKISVRDSVALDEYKTALAGAKFDFEVLKPGIELETWLEQDIKDEAGDIPQEREVGYLIAQQWKRGHIHFGSKASRGLGQTKLCKVQRAEFIWDEAGIDQWLDFDMYSENGWVEQSIEQFAASQEQNKGLLEIILSLKQEGGISIRRYTTTVQREGGNREPDYKQMSYIRGKNNKEIPVIPGTSWAGAFRHHINRITENKFEQYFGSTSHKSQIYFSESEIKGAVEKVLTHNAIDRFTGGIIDRALYTEKTWFNGKTKLKIQLDARKKAFNRENNEKTIEKEFYAALSAAILDLHLGILSVGGLTSIGRGIFSIEKIQINGEEIPVAQEAEEIPHMYQQLIQKMMEGGHA